MERARTKDGGRTAVPGRYRVRLNPADLEDCRGAGRRTRGPREPARRRRAHVRPGARLPPAGSPGVALVADPSLSRRARSRSMPCSTGRRPVPAAAAASDRPRTAARDRPQAAARGGRRSRRSRQSTRPPGRRTRSVEAVEPRPARAPGRRRPAARGGLARRRVRGDGTQTLVFRRPAPSAARALPARVVARRHRAHDRGGRHAAHARPGAGQRPRAGRLARLAPARAGCRPAAGRWSTRTSAAPTGRASTAIRVDEIALGVGDRLVQWATRSSSSKRCLAERVDGFVLTLWLVRLLFLLGALRVPVHGRAGPPPRPARGVARADGARPPRGPVRRPTASRRPGGTFPLDAVTTLGRDVNNAIVIDDPFASAEHAVLTFRGRRLVRGGPREHERDVRQRRPGRARRPARVRRRAPGGRGPVPARPGRGVSAVAQARPRRASRFRHPPPAAPDGARAARHRRGGAGHRRGLARARPSASGPRSMPATPPRASTSARSTRAALARLPRSRSGPSTSCSSSPAGARTRSCCRRSGCSGGIGLLLMQRLPAGARDPVVLRARSCSSGSSSCSGCCSRSAVVAVLGARGPLGRLAADLQVHVGGRRASGSCSRRSCSAAT